MEGTWCNICVSYSPSGLSSDSRYQDLCPCFVLEMVLGLSSCWEKKDTQSSSFNLLRDRGGVGGNGGTRFSMSPSVDDQGCLGCMGMCNGGSGHR